MIVGMAICSLSSYGETLKDFTGNYKLIKSDKANRVDCPEKLLVETDDVSKLFVGDIVFTLGLEELSEKTFTTTRIFNNTITRKFYKKTFFNRNGKLIS